MAEQLKTQASKSRKDLSPLTDDAKAAIVDMRGAAREAAEFAVIDDTIGEGIERLTLMLWGDEARMMFDSSGNDQFPTDEPGNLVVGENGAEVEEPTAVAMALRGKRPTMATVMSLCRSDNAQDRAAGEYLKARPNLTQEGAPLTRSEEAYLQKLIAPKR